MTRAPKIQYSDTHLNFEEEDNNVIYNKYRAYFGSSFSGARGKFGGHLFFAEKFNLPSDEELVHLFEYEKSKPGSVWTIKQKNFRNYVYIRCRNGWIRMDWWRPLTKRKRESHKFIH